MDGSVANNIALRLLTKEIQGEVEKNTVHPIQNIFRKKII
jgi:hypothetical protein